jgi:hypothetical protein
MHGPRKSRTYQALIRKLIAVASERGVNFVANESEAYCVHVHLLHKVQKTALAAICIIALEGTIQLPVLLQCQGTTFERFDFSFDEPPAPKHIKN